MSWLWNSFFINPILNVLIYLYAWTGSLGLGIILLTALIRGALIPVMVPSIKSARKQRDLQPEIAKLKKKYTDKQVLAQKQMELLKKHGVNPASGCLTQIVTLIVIFALFGVIRIITTPSQTADINSRIYSSAVNVSEENPINTKFLYMDLSKPDPYYVLAILAGAVQLLLTQMSMPFSKLGQKAAKKTPGQADDMAAEAQKQMMYMMPIMNVVFGLTLPAGVVLYIVIGSLFSLGQTYFISGWGGLEPWVKKLRPIKPELK